MQEKDCEEALGDIFLKGLFNSNMHQKMEQTGLKTETVTCIRCIRKSYATIQKS